ncbi:MULTISPECIES: DUF58 domain-containing protein [unclassified Mycolicibacterium]|uniref:DUF58 domain-containing protein n=1 Tax=unclassified Mycolicibacterium TaxID=2636767 RepID=UPI0012DF5D9B|nr:MULTISPECIES: DUF58 domain-containing protein [unclassified Mycolicibacterium]MUL82524.1 DUF58 domain-containing protein [Mycolicibacterium sp. CBMA 329]MUL91344.1 DUF58 domain-containing protein [Mycolicibacterium sp. CBMA 331]MUM01467.1 DUF58 domain-containing protein [Mycolicibacterium sp. CBMA 334]MUM29986.1 DUF58 domain-containing protein [Mycolicibacterium sp. CBMA 295]MUM41768.1 DUF58 domain-containing protein [Mycolicibacterium sp. CBMA 247]
MPDTRRVEVEPHWAAAPLTRTLATVVAGVLVVAVIGSRWQLVVFAAPLLGVLCSVHWQRPAAKVHVYAEPAAVRCFESETVRLAVRVAAGDGTGCAVSAESVDGMQLDVVESDRGRLTVAACAQRWGRYPVRAGVRMVAPGGLTMGEATVDVAEVYVFPLAAPQATPIPHADLPDRLGTHLTRHTGPGVEYADVRPYVSGDHLRTVNWPVSSRRGRLHVTERLTDRGADLVVLIDANDQAAGPATRAAERTARGAAQVVQSALRSGDRAGIVVLGGRRPRWLGLDIGRRQFYRVLDTVLAAGSGFETTTGTLAPRAAVPPGAIVVAFSTLLNTEFALALIELCKRGHTVVAVDVLEGAPFTGELDPLIQRMWALQRSAMYRDMGTIGIDVVHWPHDDPLQDAMRLVPDRHRHVHRRL